MEKFSSAGIVRSWAGRSSRGLRSELCQCWASSMGREGNWSVVVSADKAESCILRSPLMAEGVGPPYRAETGRVSLSCDSEGNLWRRKSCWVNMLQFQITTVEPKLDYHGETEQTAFFFFHRIDFCKLQSYGYIFSFIWLEMHLRSCWDFTIKTSPNLWHYSWLLQVRQKERWLQHISNTFPLSSLRCPVVYN